MLDSVLPSQSFPAPCHLPKVECRGQVPAGNHVAPLWPRREAVAFNNTAHQPPTFIDLSLKVIRQLVKTHIDQKLDLSTLAREASFPITCYQLFRTQPAVLRPLVKQLE